MNDSFDSFPRRVPQAPGEAGPAYPPLSTRPPPGGSLDAGLSALDRRRFLSACARSALLAGTATILGAGAGCSPAGVPVRSDWPEERVRLVDEHPIDVTFRDGRSARLVVAIVRGDGPEPVVDRDRVREAVRGVCAGFDAAVLSDEDARATLEAALRARLDDLIGAGGGSVEAVTVAEAPPEEAPPPPASPAPEADAPAPLPAPRGRCLVHGDACPDRAPLPPQREPEGR